MLVQTRDTVFRLIRQHDHALLAGALAFAWRTPEGLPLPPSTALATALHDVVWTGEDSRPRLDPASGAPYDFTTIPPDRKAELVRSGVEHLAALDPEVADLVLAHHRTLAEGTPVPAGSPLSWLRFFDNLSLHVCLTPPGSVPEARPAWLRSDEVALPLGGEVSLEWRGEAALSVAPWPVREPVTATLRYRDLPRTRYDTQEELTAAWDAAEERVWTLRIGDGFSPA